MGADLFESYVGSIIASATLADGNPRLIALPFWIAGAGMIASFISYFFVGTKEGASQRQLMQALHKGTITASVLVVAFAAVIISLFFDGDDENEGWKIFACVVIGLVSGIIIGE
ncbi:unnamed protein product, partial [Choristocarpus tenellus]